VITTSFPARSRPRPSAPGPGSPVPAASSGCSLSAAIIDNATWPWVFALPIALAAVSFVLTIAFVPHSVEHTEAGFDIAGSLLSALAVGGLVLAFHEGPERGWTAPVTVAALAVPGCIGAVAFVLVELRRDHPCSTCASSPPWPRRRIGQPLRGVRGHVLAVPGAGAVPPGRPRLLRAPKAASGLLPMAAMMMPLSTIAPTIAERIGFRRTLVTGMLLLAGGLCHSSLPSPIPTGGYLSVLPGILVLGVGVGLAMSPSTAAITASLPEEKQGVASALNDTVREMGGAVGIALIGSVLNSAYRRTSNPPPPPSCRLRSPNPSTSGIGGALAVAGQMGADGKALVDASRQAFVDGMVPALLLAAGLSLAAAIYTALRGPKTAAEAEPRLHPTDQSTQAA
jgi:hypothetical protein